MRLPFVSRLTLDLLEKSHERERESLKEVNAVLRNSLVDVTAKYHQLRLMQHTLPLETQPVAPPAKPDPIALAIAEVAASDSELARAMSKQATIDKMAGRTADEIINAIFSGIEQDEGSPI